MSQTRDTVRFINNYGPLKRGAEYEVMGQGRDYVTVKRGGTHMHVPSYLIAPANYRFETRWVEEENEEEGYV